MNFNDELHEELFTCFILKSNSNKAYEKEKDSIELNFGIYANLCIRDYYLNWNDRTIHEERVEYQGNVFKVKNFPYEEYKEHYVKSDYNSPFQTGRIKFYFVDENKQGEQ